MVNYNIKGSFHLPIQTGIIVPSTKIDKKITATQFKKRIDMVRKKLSSLFGGYTSVSGIGGYTSDTKGLIKEDVVIVYSYAEKESYIKNKKKFEDYAKELKKKFNQESIGVFVENDLYYV